MTFDPFKAFRTDDAAENRGKTFPAFGEGVTVLVARAGNRAYQRELAAEWKAHEYTLQQGNRKDASEAEKDSAEKLSFALMGRVMARTVLLGWSGMAVAYSVEAAEKALAMRDFREVISGLAGDYRNYLVEAEKENEKNSEPTSNGTSNGVPASTSSNVSTLNPA